jgi:hypothetical protein
MRLKGLAKLTKFNYLVGSRTSDLPACSIVPQPLRYCVPVREADNLAAICESMI